MVMSGNSAWRKNNWREIAHTWERFLAIIAIIALGSGFYSGLKITRSAMVGSMDSYITQQNMYDFRLISSLGLTREDEKFFSGMDKITAEGAISMDFIAVMDNGTELVLKAHSITNNINRLYLRAGRMPEAANECVLDYRMFGEDVIGSSIKLASGNDEDIMDAFAYNEYVVVGVANSVNYLNYDRGTTKLSGGSVNAFVYIPLEGFELDYFTELFIDIADDSRAHTDEYDALIAGNKEILKAALEERAALRRQEIVDEAQDKLSDAQAKYDEGLQEYQTKKADALDELDKAWKELEEARQKITDSEAKLKDGEEKLAKAEEEYEKSVKEYKDSLKKFEKEKADTFARLDSSQKEIDNNRTQLVSAMENIEESGILEQYDQLTRSIQALEAALQNITDPNSEEYINASVQLGQLRAALAEIEASGVISRYNELQASLAQIDAGQRELDEARKKAQDEFAKAERQLRQARDKLEDGAKQKEKSKQELADGWEALAAGKAEYEKGLKEYESAKAEAEEEFAKAEDELAEAEQKIEDAKKQVEDIPEAKVYVLDRNTNMGYANFDNDSSIVEGIARILPIYFFLVAALVCMTTMTRMVDEQRTQIGTLKALGYSDAAIIGKYVSYSGYAALIGCVAGYLLGTKFFPFAIWKAYGMLYELTSLEYVFDIRLAVISLLVSLLCSAGVTFISGKAELLKMPAQLIRPRAPKPGKRVLLERLPFIWNRLSFLRKVSVRNILRYKRRLIMTVLGIAGCTSLVLAAMGISDSIRNIVNDQFDSIMTYDYNISFSEARSSDEREQFIKEYTNLLSECVFIVTQEVEVPEGGKVKKANVVATNDPGISRVIDLHYKGEQIPYPENGKVVINDKLARDFALSPGDYISIKINDAEIKELLIGGIFENYINNYIFMTAESYEELFGEEMAYKNAFAKAASDELYPTAASLAGDDKVAVVSVVNDMRVMVENMMQSLDYIIWLVIACAGALGFVVIYNLNNINITERNREIATIKVLGFYSWETRSYVFRETVVLTIIGSLVGLLLGKLLHSFIMAQINIEMISFREQVFARSYLIAAVATFVVTLLVNLILLRKLEKINMTESLKAVE